MAIEFDTYEPNDGWFYVVQRMGGEHGESINNSVTRFQTAEARAYYIQARQYEEAARNAKRRYDWLFGEFSALAGKRNVRRALKELREQAGRMA